MHTYSNPFIHPCMRASIRPSFHPSMSAYYRYVSSYVSVHLFLSIFLAIHPSIRLSIRPSVCLSICSIMLRTFRSYGHLTHIYLHAHGYLRAKLRGPCMTNRILCHCVLGFWRGECLTCLNITCDVVQIYMQICGTYLPVYFLVSSIKH